MSAVASPCPVCRNLVAPTSLEDHIAETHSDPAPTREDPETNERVNDAAYIRKYFGRSLPGADDAGPTATTVPIASIFDDLGVKVDDMASVILTTEAGAAMTAAEAKRAFSAVEKFVGFQIDRADFVVNFVDWGIRTSFTEELQNAGGFAIVSAATAGNQRKFVRVSELSAAINEEFSQAAIGRDFTFRRLGRYMAREIPKIVEMNPSLRQYNVAGSPMSNRLGVKPPCFLAVTSIFEHIKPLAKWTKDERAAWEAHNRSVTKTATGSGDDSQPMDLRIAPSTASSMTLHGLDDFSRRNNLDDALRARYGKGATLFTQMGGNPPGDRSGLGRDA